MKDFKIFTILLFCFYSYASSYELVYLFNHDNKQYKITNMIPLKDNLIASRVNEGEIKVWNALNGIILYSLNFKSDKYKGEMGIPMVYFAKMDLLAVSVTEYLNVNSNELSDIKSSIKIYDLLKGEIRYDLQGHKYNIVEMIRLENGLLASADEKGFINIWNMDNGQLKYSFAGKNDDPKYNLVSLTETENNFVAAGFTDGKVRIYDTNIGRLRYILNGSTQTQGLSLTSNIQDMKLMNDGYLAVLHNDYIKIWDLMNGKETAVFNFYDSSSKVNANKITVFPNGLIAMGDVAGAIRVYDSANKELLYTFDKSNNGHRQTISGLISLNNGNLLSASEDGLAKIWDLKNGRLVETIQSRYRIKQAILLSNSILALAHDFGDNFITVWDLNK